MDGQKPENGQAPAPMQFAPGDTIRPQQQTAQSNPVEQQPPVTVPAPLQTVAGAVPATPAAAVPEQTIEDTPAPQQTPPPQPQQIQSAPSAQQPPSFYTDTSLPNSDANMPETSDEVVTWTASEFIAHQKNGGWYALLMLGALVAAVLVWFVTKDMVSSVVIIFAGAVFATYAARKPRQLSYRIDSAGLTIDQKHYSYNEFRSFSVVPEGAFSTIVFAPLKRFGTLITLYYDPKDEERIINAIMTRLPHEERKPDPIDRMLYRIRF
ncbi:hypothetical protein BH09PAT4_BH09PAT4_08660 [soil metagenome]